MSEEEKNAKLYISGQMLLKVVEELENRIDKAREYIKKNNKKVDITYISDKATKELLEILGDKE